MEDLYPENIRNFHNSIINKPYFLYNEQKIWAETSPKKDIRMAYEHVKSQSTSVVTREMQIKTLRYNYTSIRMSKIKNDHTSIGKDVRN